MAFFFFKHFFVFFVSFIENRIVNKIVVKVYANNNNNHIRKPFIALYARYIHYFRLNRPFKFNSGPDEIEKMFFKLRRYYFFMVLYDTAGDKILNSI